MPIQPEQYVQGTKLNNTVVHREIIGNRYL